MISFLDRVENIVGNKENAGNQCCLLFPQRFQKLSVSWPLKVRLYGKELKIYTRFFWIQLKALTIELYVTITYIS